MKVGYARTSSVEQKAGFEAQLRELDSAGCERMFKEQVSSVAHREQLGAALDYIRDGDTLVVTKLDRWRAPCPTPGPSSRTYPPAGPLPPERVR
jgi:DNA invertase Pin-like site-specific DNA recombinase